MFGSPIDSMGRSGLARPPQAAAPLRTPINGFNQGLCSEPMNTGVVVDASFDAAAASLTVLGLGELRRCC